MLTGNLFWRIMKTQAKCANRLGRFRIESLLFGRSKSLFREIERDPPNNLLFVSRQRYTKNKSPLYYYRMVCPIDILKRHFGLKNILRYLFLFFSSHWYIWNWNEGTTITENLYICAACTRRIWRRYGKTTYVQIIDQHVHEIAYACLARLSVAKDVFQEKTNKNTTEKWPQPQF